MALGDRGGPLSAYFPDAVDPVTVKKSRGFRRLIVAVMVVALIPAFNATLASSITLGGGSVEFAQGAAQTSVCDSSITVALNNSYDADLDYFKVASFTLSDINTTVAGCFGKTLTVRGFTADGSEIDLNGSGTTGNNLSYLVATNSGTNASQDLAVSGNVNSATVAKVTIETS